MAEIKKGPADRPEKDPKLEAALANRMLGRGESLNDELISTAETPQQLFIGLRSIESKLENGNIPGSLTESYRPPGQLSVLFDRAEILKIPNSELVKRGWLANYIETTGEGMPTNRKYSALALKVDEKLVVDANGEYQTDILGQLATRIHFNYGIEKQRAELAHAYDRAVAELEARAILGEHIGVMLNLNIRDSLEDLVNWEHGTTAKFKADHLSALFNMPDVEEMANSPENRTLGDQLEEAIFLNLVMLNSGNKQRMQDFLDRPGAQHLMSKLAKEEEARLGSTYTRDQWITENIGNVETWVGDNDRYIYDDKDASGKNVRATFWAEAADGRRGRLTRWGNIAAFGGNPGEFTGDNEIEFIEKDVGRLVGSAEASWVAATLLRSIGTYASEGYVALPNGKSSLPLSEGNYISSDDRGKFFTYMFNWKEGTKGRPHGLRGLLGKVPDTAIDLFDWAQVAVDDLPKNKDGSRQRRSIWDAWLGTTGGKDITNLLTGEKTENTTTQEGYHRLGDLNFTSLNRDFHGTFGVMQWLLGRAEDGVYINAMNVEKFGLESFSLNQLKKMNKYIGICFNDVILTKGSPHLYSEVPFSKKRIQKNFLRNLMLARIHSAHFSMNILDSKVKMFNPDAADVEVPAAVLVKAFVDEALKDNPEDEEGLLAHYIDENKVLRKMGTGGTPGVSKDISGILDEKFEPTDSEEKRLAEYVGIVRGRKH